MARRAGFVQFTSVRIGVTRTAVGLKSTKKSAGQDGACRPRLVTLGAFDFGVAADQLKLRIFIVVKQQSLGLPRIRRVARCAGVAELILMGVFVA